MTIPALTFLCFVVAVVEQKQLYWVAFAGMAALSIVIALFKAGRSRAIISAPEEHHSGL